MQEGRWSSNEHIANNMCTCAICLNDRVQQSQNSSSKYQTQMNCMFSFLELFPRNFPLSITHTAFPKQKLFYFNRYTNRLALGQFTKLTDHFPLPVNIILHYSNSSKIVHKYYVLKYDQSYVYVQAYSAKVPHLTTYIENDIDFMDYILVEKMAKLVNETLADDNFSLGEASKYFLAWAHRDYKDYIFCKFYTHFLCRFLLHHRKVRIIKAKFYWIVEKPGQLRLNNVKYLEMYYQKPVLTFQQEYQDKVMEKLSSAPEIKLFNSNTPLVANRINSRVKNFREEIRSMFIQYKMKILDKTYKYRTIYTRTQSDYVAKLFLPELKNYKNLREILNSEYNFKKVVLGIQYSPKIQKYVPGKCKKQQFRTSTFLSKHKRSKTYY